MILSPRYLPRLASTIGLFTNYGLRELARRSYRRPLSHTVGEKSTSAPELSARYCSYCPLEFLQDGSEFVECLLGHALLCGKILVVPISMSE